MEVPAILACPYCARPLEFLSFQPTYAGLCWKNPLCCCRLCYVSAGQRHDDLCEMIFHEAFEETR